MIDDGRMVMAGIGRNHLPLIYVRDVARGVLLAAAPSGRRDGATCWSTTSR